MRRVSAGLVVLLLQTFVASPALGQSRTRSDSVGSTTGTAVHGTPETHTPSPPLGDETHSPLPPKRGETGDGRRPSREGGGGHGNNILPGVIIGAVALIAIGSLLARERDPVGQNAPDVLPSDELTSRLLRDGPHLADQFNMSAFAVRGFVRGGWPLLIDFEQRTPGTTRLSISARDLPEIFTYELSEACPPPRRCLIRMRLPPELFGNELRPAVIAATATDDPGKQTLPTFTVYALGAGPRAVGSVAIDQVAFGPPTVHIASQETARYKFFSHSDFSNTSVEFWKVENGGDGSIHYFVDDDAIDGGVRKDKWVGMSEPRQWDGLKKDQQVSPGRHKLQVRAWDRVGDWVTAWSDSMVLVAQ